MLGEYSKKERFWLGEVKVKRALRIYLTAGILLLAACSGDDRAWRKAQEENTERS
jgi:hypothetical protein